MSPGEKPVGEEELTAHLDGRLDPARREAVLAHLADRPDLAERLGRDAEIRAALRDRLAPKAAEPVPARLGLRSIVATRRRRRLLRLAPAAAACLLLVLGGAAGWVARGALGGAPAALEERWAAVAGEALAAHRTFAVEIVHPVEVKAAEEDHLRRWLSKRLGRQLIVPDLDAYGLELVGGRLLPAGREVAALLMYADQAGRRVTIYVRSGQGGESALRYLKEGELSSFTWMDGGYGYVVSGPMERERLQAIARTVAQGVDMDAARKSPHL